MKNLIKTLKSNPDLLEQVVKLWKDGAPNEKIAEAFAAKGVQVEQEQIEQLLSQFQKERAKTIENGILDKDLMKVAGGTKRVDSCQSNWFVEKCTATVEDGSLCWSNDYCAFISSKYTAICENDRLAY